MTHDIEEKLDLSDLDLLDDANKHAICGHCYPYRMKPGAKFQALCGRPAMWPFTAKGGSFTVPTDACPDCEEVWLLPCRVCGATW